MREYVLRRMLLDESAPGRPGVIITPKALVLHWTGNTGAGADAVANRNYFNSVGRSVSAHYIVDDQQVVQCLPENEMAYHVGAEKYTPKALELLSPYPNDCTLGIEMCVNRDGDFRQTYANTVALVSHILHRRGWYTDRLWRHYDVTGKVCPAYWVEDSYAVRYGFASAAEGWAQFRNDVNIALGELQGQGKTCVFTDMQGHWAREAVERACRLGLVKGVSDTDFAPDRPLTRAEGVVLVMRLYDLLAGKNPP